MFNRRPIVPPNAFNCLNGKSLLPILTVILFMSTQAKSDENHYCRQNQSMRLSNIKSFTYERLLRSSTNFIGQTTFTLTNDYNLVMLHGDRVYRMSSATVVDEGMSALWYKYAQLNREKAEQDMSSAPDSLYFFSKKDSNEQDYELSWYDANDEPKGIYQVCITTNTTEQLWSRKQGDIILSRERKHPKFSLALNPYNQGFAINKDIYSGTNEFAVYSFSYQPKNNKYQNIDYFESLIHSLEASESDKASSKYFFFELTESPNEIQLTPRHLRSQAQYNPARALFKSVPSGFIEGDRVFLFDIAAGCVYNISVESIGNLDFKYEKGKSFRVQRTNHVLQDFIRCLKDGPQAVDVAKALQCGRTFVENSPSNLSPKPHPVPEKTAIPSVEVPSSSNNTMQTDTEKSSGFLKWLWILLAVLLVILLLCIIFFMYTIFKRKRRGTKLIKKLKAKFGPKKKQKLSSKLNLSLTKSRSKSSPSPKSQSQLSKYSLKDQSSQSSYQPSKTDSSIEKLPIKINSSTLQSKLSTTSSDLRTSITTKTAIRDSDIATIQSLKPTRTIALSESTKSDLSISVTQSVQSSKSSLPQNYSPLALRLQSIHSDKPTSSHRKAVAISAVPSTSDSTIFVTQSSVPSKSQFPSSTSTATEKAQDSSSKERISGSF